MVNHIQIKQNHFVLVIQPHFQEQYFALEHQVCYYYYSINNLTACEPTVINFLCYASVAPLLCCGIGALAVDAGG